jgi:hypothetical protein
LDANGGIFVPRLQKRIPQSIIKPYLLAGNSCFGVVSYCRGNVNFRPLLLEDEKENP